MQRRRGQGDQRVDWFYIFPAEKVFAVDHAHNETRKIIFPRWIKTRHLRGFSPDQRAPHLAAGPTHAIHQLLDDVGVKLAHGQVIEKKKRLGTLHQNVVDAMIDEVAAHGGMHAAPHRYFYLYPQPPPT